MTKILFDNVKFLIYVLSDIFYQMDPKSFDIIITMNKLIYTLFSPYYYKTKVLLTSVIEALIKKLKRYS
jgi:hypothetical protein